MGALGTLASLATGPIGATVGAGVAALNAVNSARAQKDALSQLQARQGLEQREVREKARLEREENKIRQEQDEDERRAALKRAVARARANSSARGINPASGGSSDAILLGLFEESDEERERREALDKIREQSLQQSVSSVQQRNLLELSEARRKNSLSNLF